MPKNFVARPALVAALLVGVVMSLLTALLVNGRAAAAPAAQTSLPDFTLNANTVLSVTVAVTDGLVIVVPVDLTFIAENDGGTTDVAVIAEVEQQAGIFIGVAPAGNVAATIQLPGQASAPNAAATPLPSVTVGDGEGTHVANSNSNLRAGPGTDFEIVGRVPAGGFVTIVGQNNDGTWLQLDNGSWIAEFLVAPVAQNNQNDNNDNDNNGNNDEGEDDEEATDEAQAEDTQTNNANDPAIQAQVALANYLVDIALIGAGATDSVTALNALMVEPQPLNAEWRNNVAAQLGVLAAALDQYLALTPVEGYEALHSEVTSVALTCDEAVSYLRAGLDNPRIIDPEFATQQVQSCAAQASELALYLETVD
jgi:uncharacterized protein YgiM (DUF1202 family)